MKQFGVSMTYAVGMVLDKGLAFISDTRTNAGIDNISTFKKMHIFESEGSYCITLLLAGNLATTQEVAERVRELLSEEKFLEQHLSMFQVAKSVGKITREVIREALGESSDPPPGAFGMTAIVGGELQATGPRLFLVYPEGNFIEAQEEAPFFQIGETKYGKPLLVARYQSGMNESEAYDLLVKSLEITSYANLSVGLPADFHLYRSKSLKKGHTQRLTEFDQKNSVIAELSRVIKPDLPNPALQEGDEDVMKMLVELRDLIQRLSGYIRSINDPVLASADVKAALAYIDSFQEFIDLDGANKPETIPGDLTSATQNSLKKVDWAKLSDHAQKWAKARSDLIKAFGG